MESNEAIRLSFQEALQTAFIDFMEAGGTSNDAHTEMARALGDLIWRIKDGSVYPLGKIKNAEELEDYLIALSIHHIESVVKSLDGNGNLEIVGIFNQSQEVH